MKIHRNTINNDIQILKLEIAKEMVGQNLKFRISKHMDGFDWQETRLREELDNTKEPKERRGIEKLLLKNRTTHLQFLLKIGVNIQDWSMQAEVKVSEEEIKELVTRMVFKSKFQKYKTNVYSAAEIESELIRKTKCDVEYARIVYNKMLDLGLALCRLSKTNEEYFDDNYSPRYDLGKFALERNYKDPKKPRKIRKKVTNAYDDNKQF